MFSEGIKYPDSALKRSLGSRIRSGVHFQNIRTLLTSIHAECPLRQGHTMGN